MQQWGQIRVQNSTNSKYSTYCAILTLPNTKVTELGRAKVPVRMIVCAGFFDLLRQS